MSTLTVTPIVRQLTVTPTVRTLTIQRNASTPTGPAGGDLAGSYPNPTVEGILGNPIDDALIDQNRILVYKEDLPAGPRWEFEDKPSGTVSSITAGTGLTGGTITTSGTIAANFGTAAGTVCQGNDARLSDARTPLSHTHGNITNAGAIGSTSGLPIKTGTGGVLEAGAFGTTAGTFCEGNDARLAAQTITLTGDVTGSGTGSFAATIANDAVTYAKMQNVSATDRLLGRSSAGAGDVEEIVCTAYARGLLDDADAVTARTTLGLGSTDTPTFTALILQNGEEIRNTTDGRIDLLPKPNAANQVGITFNMVQRSNIVSVGTLRTSNGVLNDGSVQWDAKQIIGNNVDFVVSAQDWSAFRQVVGTGLKQTLAIGVSANFNFGGTDISSGSVAIMHRFHMGQANRTPSTTHVDPHLYIYSQDNTQANDFVRFSHNQTDGVIETGAGNLNLVSASGTINNNGNRIPKVFSGTTPPSAGTGDDGDLYFEY